MLLKANMLRNIFIGLLMSCLTLLSACSGAKHMQVNLPDKAPEQKVTRYSDALLRFGEMTEVFDPGNFINVQSKEIVDKTGTSRSGKVGEIPFDITEMTQSAVNRIGGKIIFIPYDPRYLQEQQAYLSDGLTPPDIVLCGAITEYDRSTEVIGDSADFGGEFGAGGAMGVDAGFSNKLAVSSISIDMNVIDFATMSMVSQVQAVNTIKVYKGAKESDVGFSIFGQSFGLKGTVKKIQGRHAAVRTLVEMCVLECLGKFMDVPYWKCVEGANEDKLVLKHRKNLFKQQNDINRTWMIQQLMPAYGIEGISSNGVYGERTRLAMKTIAAAYKTSRAGLTAKFYIDLFRNAPFFEKPSFNIDKLNTEIAALPVEKTEPVAQQPEQNSQQPQTSQADSASPQQGTAAGQSGAKVSSEEEVKDVYSQYMAVGKSAFKAQKFDKARDSFVQACKLSANLQQPIADPFIYLAYSYQSLGNMESCGKVLKLGMQYVHYSEPLYRVYIRYLISANRIDEADTYLAQGLKINPQSKILLSLKDYIHKMQK